MIISNRRPHEISQKSHLEILKKCTRNSQNVISLTYRSFALTCGASDQVFPPSKSPFATKFITEYGYRADFLRIPISLADNDTFKHPVVTKVIDFQLCCCWLDFFSHTATYTVAQTATRTATHTYGVKMIWVKCGAVCTAAWIAVYVLQCMCCSGVYSVSCSVCCSVCCSACCGVVYYTV